MLLGDDMLRTLTPFGFDWPPDSISTPDILDGVLDAAEESVDLQTFIVSSAVCN